MGAPPAVLNRGAPSPGLVWELVLRDVRLRYRRSVLGIVWSQVTPLAYAAVLTVVFTRVVPLDIDDYPAFVLLGMLPWLWFQSALVAATSSVVVAPDLLRQPGFPRVALPVAAVASSLAHHALGLPVLLVAAAAAAGGLSATALALVPLLALQALLVLGPAFVLAAVHVRLRDTAHLVGVVLLPVFYATPVFYDAASLERVAWLRWINPMVHVVDAHRAALLRQEWPAVMPLLGVALAGLGLLAIGLLVYRRGMGRFLEHV